VEAMLLQWKLVYNKAKGSSIIINKMNQYKASISSAGFKNKQNTVTQYQEENKVEVVTQDKYLI